MPTINSANDVIDIVLVPSSVTRSETLSFDAIGMFTFICSLGKVDVSKIKCRYHKRTKIFQELEKEGYLSFHANLRDSSGNLASPWRMHTDPLPLHLRTDSSISKRSVIGICVYCGGPANSIDHLLPTSRGGTNDDYNLVTSCISCNSKKGNRTPEEAGMEVKYGC